MEEIYFDVSQGDLVWLPKHSNIINLIASELNKNGIHFDPAILTGAVYLRTTSHSGKYYNGYFAWSCDSGSASALLNHPKIKDILMPEETVKVPVAFLRDLYVIECVSDLREVLKKNFAEVFGEPIKLSRGQVFLKGRTILTPYIISQPTDFVMVNLADGWPWSEVKSEERLINDLIQTQYEFRPMRSGTIIIKVIDGKVAGAAIRED